MCRQAHAAEPWLCWFADMFMDMYRLVLVCFYGPGGSGGAKYAYSRGYPGGYPALIAVAIRVAIRPDSRGYPGGYPADSRGYPGRLSGR